MQTRFYSLLRESGSLTRPRTTAARKGACFYSLLRESGSLTNI